MPGYPARAQADARDSDVTPRIGETGGPGGEATLRSCRESGEPASVVEEGQASPSDVAAWA